MSTSVNHTPVSVKPRRMDFPFADMKDGYFFDDNILKSAYIAALSATFPEGEAEFIASVRLFRDQIDDKEMQEQISGFIGQEAHHSQQHKAFNQKLKGMGFDVPRLEKVFEKHIHKNVAKRSPAERLALTVCFEHLTAILAEEFLGNPERLVGMDDTIAKMLRWHSVEEIEHKSVAFDLYMSCVGNRKLLHKAQRWATFELNYRNMLYIVRLLWWEKKLPRWRDIKGFYKFMFGKQGLLKRLRQPYLEFFREDFHPWDVDNTDMIDQWKQTDYVAEWDKGSQAYKTKQAA